MTGSQIIITVFCLGASPEATARVTDAKQSINDMSALHTRSKRAYAALEAKQYLEAALNFEGL